MLVKIIHQLSTSYAYTRKWKTFIDSVRTHHPDWQYWFWTSRHLDDLVAKQYPHLWTVYQSFSPIQRLDMARYCVLHTYGGLYVDTDIYVVRSLDPLIDPRTVTLAPSVPTLPGGTHKYTNYLIYSPRGHPYWPKVFQGIIRASKKNKHIIRSIQVSRTTGRALLSKYADSTIKRFDSKQIYDLNCPQAMDKVLKQPDLYAVHFGGTARTAYNGAWFGNIPYTVKRISCACKRFFGMSPNGYQAPLGLLYISLVGLGILIALVVVSIKRQTIPVIVLGVTLLVYIILCTSLIIHNSKCHDGFDQLLTD